MNFKFKSGLCLIYIIVKWSIIHFIQFIQMALPTYLIGCRVVWKVRGVYDTLAKLISR